MLIRAQAHAYLLGARSSLGHGRFEVTQDEGEQSETSMTRNESSQVYVLMHNIIMYIMFPIQILSFACIRWCPLSAEHLLGNGTL